MSLNLEERTAVVTYRLEKAERALLQAKANIPLMTWEVIANRIYYAAYYLDKEDVLPLVGPAEQLIADVSRMAESDLKNKP